MTAEEVFPLELVADLAQDDDTEVTYKTPDRDPNISFPRTGAARASLGLLMSSLLCATLYPGPSSHR